MAKKTITKKETKDSKKKVKEDVKVEVEDLKVEDTEELVEEELVEESDEVKLPKTESTDSLSDQKDEKPNETVEETFDDITKLIETEIDSLKNGISKIVGVKFLRSLNKKIKLLKVKTSRSLKQKTKGVRKHVNNANSGFLKPVKISKEMGKFTGWGVTDLHSRVDVTKFICKYIKDNNLQNPSDRRQIMADTKLSKLLNYDSAKDDKPLTYYRIQSYIKPHFVPTATATEVA